MYNNLSGPVGAGVVGGAALATTGASILWVVLAGFALLAAGMALTRIAPKLNK